MKKLICTVSAVLFLILTLSVNQTPTATAQELVPGIPGMVAYWPFDEGAGTTAFDHVSSNDGIITDATWTDGMVGGALHFDGFKDWVGVYDSPSLSLTPDFTAELWFKNERPNWRGDLLTKGDSPREFHVYMNTEYGEDYIYASFKDSAQQGVSVRSDPFQAYQWYHLVFRVIGGHGMDLYLNGSPQSVATSLIPGDNMEHLVIGNTCDGKYGFEGIIDEVALYNRPLSDEEIQEHYELGLAGIGCHGCWDTDGDRYYDEACGGLDCDDTNPDINPDGEEICDEIDWDCSGAPQDKDVDGDGYIDDDPVCAGDDCDDSDPNTYPGASEICDGNDNNCDGITDEGFEDADGDGSAICVDCDDTDPAVNPGVAEVCDNGIDDDCDGLVDDWDTDCAEFSLLMDISYGTSEPGMLDLDFIVGATHPSVWVTVAFALVPSVQIIPLWTVSLPVMHPAVEMEFSFPFPDLGWVGIYSGLYYEGSRRAYDLDWIRPWK